MHAQKEVTWLPVLRVTSPYTTKAAKTTAKNINQTATWPLKVANAHMHTHAYAEQCTVKPAITHFNH